MERRRSQEAGHVTGTQAVVRPVIQHADQEEGPRQGEVRRNRHGPGQPPAATSLNDPSYVRRPVRHSNKTMPSDHTSALGATDGPPVVRVPYRRRCQWWSPPS